VPANSILSEDHHHDLHIVSAFTLSPHVIKKEQDLLMSFLLWTLILLDHSPTLMTSCILNCLFIGPLSKYSLEFRASPYEFWEGTNSILAGMVSYPRLQVTLSPFLLNFGVVQS
jgi:hypothetical protein